MTTHIQAARPSALHRILRANAVFSAISGAIFLFGSTPLASFMGLPDGGFLIVIGIGVLLFCVLLFQLTARPQLDRRLAIGIFILDTLWVVFSVIALLGNLLPLNDAGRWTIVLLAEAVAVFAIAEFVALWKTRHAS